MNKKIILLFMCFWVAIAVVQAPVAGAVKVAPLHYNVELSQGQKKKGFIDVTNTDQVKAKYIFTVQAFKQLNAAGDLQFYDDATIKAGIALDYDTYELAPHQTLRLAFIADGAKLPSGDSFAAIFAAAAPKAGAGATSVRVGTILTIQNGTPAEHKAEITNLNVPFFQIGDAIKGSYAIKNTSDPKKSAGFMPQVEVTIDPLHQYVRNQSSLVFAGIERQNNFSVPTGRFGFYKVAVAFGDSKKETWVFFATPFGLFMFFAITVVVGFLVIALIKIFRSPERGVRRGTKRHIPGRD